MCHDEDDDLLDDYFEPEPGGGDVCEADQEADSHNEEADASTGDSVEEADENGSAPHLRPFYDEAFKAIEEEYDANRLPEDHYDELMETADRWQREYDEQYQRLQAEYDPARHTDLDLDVLRHKHAGRRRSLEFRAMGIDLGGLMNDWDHVLRNLDDIERDDGRQELASQWRSLTRRQQQDLRDRFLARGMLTPEEFDEFAKEHL